MTSEAKVKRYYPAAIVVKSVRLSLYDDVYEVWACRGGRYLGQAKGNQRRAWCVAAANLAGIIKINPKMAKNYAAR